MLFLIALIADQPHERVKLLQILEENVLHWQMEENKSGHYGKVALKKDIQFQTVKKGILIIWYKSEPIWPS